jgi:hypothetical protein
MPRGSIRVMSAGRIAYGKGDDYKPVGGIIVQVVAWTRKPQSDSGGGKSNPKVTECLVLFVIPTDNNVTTTGVTFGDIPRPEQWIWKV